MLRNVSQNTVTPVTGTIKIPGLERKPQSLGCRIPFVHCKVAPPDPPVVPQVVVGVLIIHTQSEFGLISGHFQLCWLVRLMDADPDSSNCADSVPLHRNSS